MTLTNKLAAATGGSRELDAEIFNISTHLHYPSPMVAYELPNHQRFLPRWRCRFVDQKPKETDEKLPRFTTSIDAALTLVPEGWEYELYGDKPNAGKNVVQLGDIRSEAKTLPLAICIAALKARGIE